MLYEYGAMNRQARRRVWVRRLRGSATLVSCFNEALVDELRDMVILKFANSLGRMLDSPDLVIKITPRRTPNLQILPERFLSPNEELSSVLNQYYYPGGQTIEEALIIDALSSRITELLARHLDCLIAFWGQWTIEASFPKF